MSPVRMRFRAIPGTTWRVLRLRGPRLQDSLNPVQGRVQGQGPTCREAGQRSWKGRSPRDRMRLWVRCTSPMSTSPCSGLNVVDACHPAVRGA